MIHVGRITPAEAHTVLNHPAIIGHITEDPIELPCRVDQDHHLIHLGAFMDYELVGCYMLSSKSFHWVEGHVALLPEARGLVGIEIGKQAIRWVWNNSEAKLITSPIPACNKKSSAYARSIGMTHMQRIPKIWLKNGQLWDINIFKVERG